MIFLRIKSIISDYVSEMNQYKIQKREGTQNTKQWTSRSKSFYGGNDVSLKKKTVIILQIRHPNLWTVYSLESRLRFGAWYKFASDDDGFKLTLDQLVFENISIFVASFLFSKLLQYTSDTYL